MRCTASLPEICGPAPELSKDGSCSKLLRSQPWCSPTPGVLVWHRDHTRRSYKMASRMPGFELCLSLGIFVASVLFSAKRCKKHSPESNNRKEEHSSDAWHFSTQVRKPLAVAKAPSRIQLSRPRSMKPELIGQHFWSTHAKFGSWQGQLGQSSMSKSKSSKVKSRNPRAWKV